MLDRLEVAERRLQEIDERLAQPEVLRDQAQVQALVRERASLEPTVATFREYRRTTKELDEARAILSEEKNRELQLLAEEEIDHLERERARLERELRLVLLPRDPNDTRNVIVEIRAGAGGGEAALFAGELYRMYTRYAQRQGWHVDLIDKSETGLGGLKEVILEVRGKGAFSRLKYERGVHRVQRVPVTEASGRIHTSTITVAVLPEPEEVEVTINPGDLRIDIFHAGGHGGQSVQKVATAVRIIHIPTGIVAVCQDERSQLQNKQKAMTVLSARIYELERSKKEREIAEARKEQVGTGERAEKMRTYNFPQNRVTDHRIGVTFHGLEKVLEGELDE
ncbi:MAG: peptide chain release factor 1, partial [Chloroflexi bacterium]|nr:peptide chain release factor 1 [Chloroflexota bacterium]